MGLAAQAVNDKSQRWWYLSSIQLAGGVISIPVIAVGSEVLFSNGIGNALFSIFIGNLIALLISYGIILMSYNHRLNAIENATQFIGKIGGRVLALLILITMIGWIGWELSSGIKLLQLHPFFSKFSVGSLIGIAASLILLMGIKGLKTLCIISVIPLIVLLFIILSIAEPSTPSNIFFKTSKFLDLSGISLVISSSVAAVVDYPTFFRHSKTLKDSFIALIVIFVITSLMQTAGVLLFRVFSMNNGVVAKIIYNNDAHTMIVIWFLIISMITSVAWNIYAASVGWESLFPIFKDRTEYAVIGLIATILISYVPQEHIFVGIATLSDAIISGLAGVLIVEFINRKKASLYEKLFVKNILYNNISWLVGAILGVMSYFNFLISRENCIFTSLLGGLLTAVVIAGSRTVYKKFAK